MQVVDELRIINNRPSPVLGADGNLADGMRRFSKKNHAFIFINFQSFGANFVIDAAAWIAIVKSKTIAAEFGSE